MGLRDRYARFEWRSDTLGSLDGQLYFFETGLGFSDAPEGATFVFKPRQAFERYVEVIGDSPTKEVLELGIFAGGSLLVLADLFDVERLVGVDIDKPQWRAEETIRRHPLGSRIHTAFETSQDDEASLDTLCAAEFPGGVDIVIDDASHLYSPSRRSFEILFPKLRRGGWYVLEDWGWVDATGAEAQTPPLANLVLELMLAWLWSPTIIGRVVVEREMVFVQKGPEAPMAGPLRLDDLYSASHRLAGAVSP